MASTTGFPTNDFTDNVSVDSLFELREVFSRVNASIEVSSSHANSLERVGTNGRATLFESHDPDQYYGGNWQNLRTINAWHNENEHGEWNNPDNIEIQSYNFRSIFQQVIDKSPVGDKSYWIGLDIDNVELRDYIGNTTTYTNNWEIDRARFPDGWDSDPGNSEEYTLAETSSLIRFEESDVLIKLTDKFWNNVQSIRDDASSSQEPPSFEVDSSFTDGTKIIDLSQIDADNYRDFAAEFTTNLDFSISSNDPLYGTYFTDFNSSVVFRSNSGKELRLNSSDTDNPWDSISGLASVDVEIDETGNHVSTDLEYGFKSYQVNSLLSSLYEAPTGTGSLNSVSSTDGTYDHVSSTGSLNNGPSK